MVTQAMSILSTREKRLNLVCSFTYPLTSLDKSDAPLL